ncbi:MAG: type I-D CRISPR-associated protein Cas5/Csc1 [Chloroflexi bacterium]|nr:type I-D CRISPR-associated protein Cas5/Csc1 [Chloroflexota bacterium]
MRVYLCRLTLHENLFFATREVGRLYETGRYLHNYALTYALGLTAAPYFHREQVPRYGEQLHGLNERGIYVTPARGVEVEYSLATFKYADNHYHVQMEPGRLNTPSFGRAKEIAVGSVFEFVVLSAHEVLSVPRWIRLGLWRSKAAISVTHTTDARASAQQEHTASLPLNPLDVPAAPRVFDLISMPPSSLIDYALVTCDWWMWQATDTVWRLPQGMQYTIPG